MGPEADAWVGRLASAHGESLSGCRCFSRALKRLAPFAIRCIGIDANVGPDLLPGRKVGQELFGVRAHGGDGVGADLQAKGRSLRTQREIERVSRLQRVAVLLAVHVVNQPTHRESGLP